MQLNRTWIIFGLAIAAGLLAVLSGLQLQPEHAGALILANGAALAEPGKVKELLEGILKGFEDFKKTNDERLSKVEKGAVTGDFDAKLAAIQTDIASAMAMKKQLDLLESKLNVKGLFGAANINPEAAAYKTAFFDRFVRKGDETGMRELSAKAVTIGTPADGGYAVPEELDREIEKLARDLSPMRSIARVVRVGTSDYKKLVNKNGIASGWVGEADARPATGTSALAEIAPFMGEIYANPQVSQQALDDIFYDVEADVSDQLVEEFAIGEGAAFFVGNGTNKPKGFLAYTTAATADSSRAFGTIEHVATGVAGDFAASNKADILYDVLGKLKAAYRAGSVWTMNKAVMFEVMKFKDTTGQYLWQPRLTDNGIGLMLLGHNVVEAEDMPAKAASSLSIAFGNFRRGYTIVDRVGMRMLRDPYTNKPYVGFYTTKRVGGMVVNSEAIKVVKFAVS